MKNSAKTKDYTRKKKFNLWLTRISKKLKLTTPLNMPANIMIEPTNICNLKCPGCPTGSNKLPFKQGRMALTDFKKLLDELGPYATYAQLWGFGEPFLHPDILEMVNYCRQFNLEVRISTNGQFFEDPSKAEALVKSGLSSMKISLDGASQETLQKYRVNASFDKIINGIRLINEAKQKLKAQNPRLVLQFIIMKHNQHEIPIMKALAADLKMKYKGKSVWVEEENAEDLLPDDRYSRFVMDPTTKSLRPAKKPPALCPFPWEWAMVNWDGSVVPCCKDPYRYHHFGNVSAVSYKSIWRSKSYATFRKQFIKDPSKLKKCDICVFST